MRVEASWAALILALSLLHVEKRLAVCPVQILNSIALLVERKLPRHCTSWQKHNGTARPGDCIRKLNATTCTK
eukprot:5633602-Pleurochrysis_carterae.AAC.1